MVLDAILSTPPPSCPDGKNVRAHLGLETIAGSIQLQSFDFKELSTRQIVLGSQDKMRNSKATSLILSRIQTA